MRYGDGSPGGLFDEPAGVTPSVLGGGPEDDGTTTGSAQQQPETVYLASERVTDPRAEVTLELRATTDGYVVMLAFTSLEALVAGCGEGQPWVAVRGDQVDELRELSGANEVLWDGALPEEERRSRYDVQYEQGER